MTWRLSLPKQVIIKNKPVVLLHAALCVLIVFVLALRFFLAHPHVKLEALDLSPNIRFDVAVGLQEPPSHLKSALCVEPEKYSGLFRVPHAETQECRVICDAATHPSSTGNRCALSSELYIRESVNQLLFVSRREIVSGAGNSTDRRAYFLPDVDMMGLSVTILSDVDLIRNRLPKFSHNPILTLILDHKGRVNRTLEAGAAAVMTVSDLLWLAGAEGYLNPQQMDNPWRVVGGEVSLLMDCTASAPTELCVASTFSRDRCWRQWTPPRHEEFNAVCLLRPVFEYGRQAVHEVIVSDAAGESSNVRSHGLRVTCRGVGYFRHVDADSVFVNIIIVIILLDISKRYVTMFIVTRCLGRISTLYKRSLQEVFDHSAQIASVAKRLLTSTAVFQQLRDKVPNRLQNVNDGGISMDEGLSRLRLALQEDVCKHMTAEQEGAFLIYLWDAARTRLRSSPEPSEDEAVQPMTFAEFGIENADALAVAKAASQLFDEKAKKGCHRRRLEQWFYPADIRHDVEQAYLNQLIKDKPVSSVPCSVREKQAEGDPEADVKERTKHLAERIRRAETLFVDTVDDVKCLQSTVHALWEQMVKVSKGEEHKMEFHRRDMARNTWAQQQEYEKRFESLELQLSRLSRDVAFPQDTNKSREASTWFAEKFEARLDRLEMLVETLKISADRVPPIHGFVCAESPRVTAKHMPMEPPNDRDEIPAEEPLLQSAAGIFAEAFLNGGSASTRDITPPTATPAVLPSIPRAPPSPKADCGALADVSVPRGETVSDFDESQDGGVSNATGREHWLHDETSTNADVEDIPLERKSVATVPDAKDPLRATSPFRTLPTEASVSPQMLPAPKRLARSGKAEVAPVERPEAASSSGDMRPCNIGQPLSHRMSV